MSNVSIKPLGKRVLILPQPAEEVTRTGIYIPDSAKEKPQRGEVIAIGSNEEIEVKVGEIVLYGKYSGSKLEYNGTEYLIMEHTDILAVI